MITIDFAKAADLPHIHELHIQTLGASFTESASSKLRALCRYDNRLHLVARIEQTVIGSIEFRSVTLEGVGFASDQKMAYLGPLVTRREYHGKGLGSKLMDAGLSLIQSKGYSVVFLTGDIAYYSRFGFRSVRPHNILLSNEIDSERLLVKMLGRPLVLPVYAHIIPYGGTYVDQVSGSLTAILEHSSKQPWRETAA